MRVKQYVSVEAASYLLAAGLILFPLTSQAQSTVIGAGYTTPQPTDASPGQLITIFAVIAGKTPADPLTASPPLPTTLGGFSVLLRQTFIDPILIPVLSVSDAQSCSNVAPLQCSTVSQITVQIPFELMANTPHVSLLQNFARLEITYNSSPAGSLFLNPVPDSIHILNSCDVASGLNATSCVPLVKHGNGTLVTSANPARTGETVTISLVGLGQPEGSVATGVAAPPITPTLGGVLIGYDARVNASPSMLFPTSAAPLDGTQLRPGAVGIYEVPFQVPALPAGVDACGSTVRSNLTVTIQRTTSFGGVGICVVPNSQ
jgi:uncharacterized protein (TIGR03437 family)